MCHRCMYLLLLLGVAVVGAQPQQLEHRPESATKPILPAPMKVPQTLEAPRAANSNSLYQALRTRTANGEAFTIKDVVLRRDAGVFTLSSGTIYLYGPVSGRITGAVFLGEGVLHLDPPSAMERR